MLLLVNNVPYSEPIFVVFIVLVLDLRNDFLLTFNLLLIQFSWLIIHGGQLVLKAFYFIVFLRIKYDSARPVKMIQIFKQVAIDNPFDKRVHVRLGHHSLEPDPRLL